MRIRHLFATIAPALSLALAAPAAAQSADEGWDDIPAEAESNGDIWDDDPYAEQDDMVLVVDELVGAILDMPIGRIAAMIPGDLVETDIDVRPGDTVRDMALREDPQFEERARGGARAMTSVVGNMMREFNTLLPELRAIGDRLGRAIED